MKLFPPFLCIFAQIKLTYSVFYDIIGHDENVYIIEIMGCKNHRKID